MLSMVEMVEIVEMVEMVEMGEVSKHGPVDFQIPQKKYNFFRWIIIQRK